MSHDYDTITGALRSHGSSIHEAEVRGLLKHVEGQALADWAKIHLTPDTLLSVHELELYEIICRNGLEKALASRAEQKAGSGARPLAEAELRVATEALARSTETILMHKESLQAQSEAISRLENTEKRAKDIRAQSEAHTFRRWEASTGSLSADVAELCRSMECRLVDLRTKDQATSSRLSQAASERCHTDDRLLDSFQKLGWSLTAVNDTADQQQALQLRNICARLIKHTVETIRTRLDRVYLEALEMAPSSLLALSAPRKHHKHYLATITATSAPGEEDACADLAALQDELESLYSEILSVAQITVEQKHLEPTMALLFGKAGQRLATSLLALDYISDCLDFLLEQIGLLAERSRLANDHQRAARVLAEMAQAEVAVRIATPKKMCRTMPESQLSPAHRRMASVPSIPTSPVRGGYAGGGGMGFSSRVRHRQSASMGGLLADISPLSQLLQQLSLSLPVPEVMTAIRANTRLLQAILSERSRKADGIIGNLQESFETAATAYLSDSGKAVWAAQSSVLTESPFWPAQLADPEIDESIAVVGQEVSMMHTRMESIYQALKHLQHGSSSKKTELVARWS